MRLKFPLLAIALFLVACNEPAPSNGGVLTPSAEGTVSSEEWDSLSAASLSPVRPVPDTGCQTSPVPVRSGLAPTISGSTALAIRAQQPTLVLWRLVGDYRGPILLRGRQYDGDAPVYFATTGTTLTGVASLSPNGPELKTQQSSAGVLHLYGGMRVLAHDSGQSWSIYTYTDGRGCFFWQQNGRSYEGIITFGVTD